MENEDREYIKILKAIMEVPFSVGKNLLVDILRGDYKNKSISRNCLDELDNFGVISWEKEKILDHIETLIRKGMIEVVTSDYNRFVKVLKLTLKGRNEIIRPTLNGKKQNNELLIRRSRVDERDRQRFSELDSFLNGFNEDQKKAIISESNKVLCIAGAGSGKTTTLTKRIEFLVKYKGVSPKDILAITFTRKAKEEMEKRLFSFGIDNINMHTFNSFCEGILKRYEKEIYEIPMRVQSYQDRILAMNMALSNLGLTMNEMIEKYFTLQQKKFKTPSQLANSFMNDCFSLMEYFKMSGVKNYDFSNDVDIKDKNNAKNIYQIIIFLEEHMKIQGLRDYADQLIDAIEFFKKNGLSIPMFRHVLVDEYQDVNAIQMNLLKLLNPNNLFLVGDPRQSIFGWRGSSMKYILDFEKNHPNADIIHLTKNYRSDKKIVEFMNHSISEMGLPDLKWSGLGCGEINIIDFENEIAEMTFIINQICESKTPFDEIFILARTNRQLIELSSIMTQRKIPHIVRTDEVKKPIDKRKGEVTLATIHAIKGLEAKKVFVMGCNEQNFPCKASDHPIIEMVKMNNYDRIEEEKRLFYVAVSRAKEKLYLTYSGKKPTYFINNKMISMNEDSPSQNQII